jgi:colanic acid/amylovoran biosynthesis glycosyltransferase
MAYLLSQYPAVSHTFFLKELLGLKQLGFQIETASINPPDRPEERLSSVEAEEAKHIWYIKKIGYWKAASILLAVVIRHPRVLLRGISSVLELPACGLYRRVYAGLYLAEAFFVGYWMKQRGLKHLHVHFGGPVSTVGMLVSQSWGVSYSLTIHGPEEFYDVGEFYLRQKIRQAKFIFCISDFCRSQLMKYSSPAEWNKLQVIRLGICPEEFAPQPRASNGVVSLICVGRLVPAKGQMILARAIAALLALGHPLRAVFVGDGPDRKALESFITERGLSSQIIVCGALNHDQTREQLAQADIFALPSFAEGVPVALMEAMAMEIPCVSTYVAGIPELIRNNVDGILVPASSEEELTAAIERLVLDGELRRRLGVSARERVLERYNLPENLKLLASAFERSLS